LGTPDGASVRRQTRSIDARSHHAPAAMAASTRINTTQPAYDRPAGRTAIGAAAGSLVALFASSTAATARSSAAIVAADPYR
jgi:hypothetical protein